MVFVDIQNFYSQKPAAFELCVAVFFEGFYLEKLKWIERILFAASAFLLLFTLWKMHLIGVILFGLRFIAKKVSMHKKRV